MEIDTVISILDLATKYMVEFICQVWPHVSTECLLMKTMQDALNYLRSMLPFTLVGYQQKRSLKRLPEYKPLIAVILAAWKYDVPDIIPTALYLLCRRHYRKIQAWGDYNDPTISRIAALCVYGYPKLLRLKRTINREAAQLAVSELEYGSRPFHCFEYFRRELIAIVMFDHQSDEIADQDEEDVELFLPEGCVSQLAPFEGSNTSVCADYCLIWAHWKN
jgi:hypothetical protein